MPFKKKQTCFGTGGYGEEAAVSLAGGGGALRWRAGSSFMREGGTRDLEASNKFVCQRWRMRGEKPV